MMIIQCCAVTTYLSLDHVEPVEPHQMHGPADVNDVLCGGPLQGHVEHDVGARPAHASTASKR